MEYLSRKFISDVEIRQIGDGLLDYSLPKPKWTHEAHFAAVTYFLLQRPDIHPELQMPSIISEYNIAVGGKNTDTSGYHETLTQFYIKLIRSFLNRIPEEMALTEVCNQLVSSPFAQRDYPLKFYSKELLFSPKARKGWVEPDLLELNFS